MQAMAPSNSLVPHEGQTVGKGGAATGLAAGDAGGLAPLPTGGAEAAWAAPGTATGGGTAARGAAGAGTMNGCLHDGQRIPPALSGTCIDFVQCGQRIICGMSCVSTTHYPPR